MEKTMKKLLLVSMVACLCACASEDSSGEYLPGDGAGGPGTGGAQPGAGGAGGGTGGMTGGGTGGMVSGATGGMTGGGTGGMTGSGTGGMTTGGGTPGTLSVDFTTISYGGQYAPKNYVAVWIEDGNGTFVKTLSRSAGDNHASDLVAWTAASGGWGSIFFPGGNEADKVDAVSTATLNAHQAHVVPWNLEDAGQQVVADGAYVAVVEMSEDEAATRSGPIMRIDFTKGPQAQTVERPDDASFSGTVVRYTP